MSVFIEHMVKRKRRLKDRIIFIAVILMEILIPITFFVLALNRVILAYFVYIALFLFLFGIWFIWYVRSHQNVEFEYQLIQDTLVVSKIIAMRKRKEILKADIRAFDLLEKGNSPEIQKLNFVKVYDVAENSNDDENTYYAVYQHPAYGRTAIMFTPDDSVLGGMKPYLKREIVLKLFYHRG